MNVKVPAMTPKTIYWAKAVAVFACILLYGFLTFYDWESVAESTGISIYLLKAIPGIPLGIMVAFIVRDWQARKRNQ